MNFNEIEALVASAKAENKLSKEKLAEEFKPFIINLSNKTFINGYDRQDIQNECYRILFKCVSIYNLEKHRFVAYATNGIKNSINDLITKSVNRSSSEGCEALILSDNLEHTLPSTAAALDDLLCNKANSELLKQSFNNLTEDEKELIIFVYFKNNPLKTYAYWKNMCYSTATKKKKTILNKMKQHLSISYEC
ncbi:RNA polymerase factor sigma-70 [Clostridium puniceum]|uniref:RNA polymerase factor sigma-70 n=1 Tax=Clostridium puniceum TaxID=29367 RepID=A0A1S8TMK0_9CLOT|nr:sigma-70 family RNA polymerase sigma factor [Clostridium puniceum]OOM78997.1 RNA polymerase factor sigma-70 [Clostridium puniceum]